MKNQSFLLATAAFVLGVVNGCEVNPFSPPETAKPGDSSSSSGSSSNSSSGMSGSNSSSGMSSSGMAGAGGAGGAGGGSGGMAGTGGSGGCVCADDNNDCTTDVTGNCPNDDPAACHTIQLGATCAAGFCDDTGACIDCLTCTDAACAGRCNGVTCAMATECKSAVCEDALCCDKACAGPCQSCNREGVGGTCTRMPNGLQLPGCDANMICNNAGACVMRVGGKAALGALCTNSSQCQSGLCRRQYCQSAVGEPCLDHMECDTSLCDPTTKTCKSCTGADAGMCPTGTTCIAASGRCTVLLGQPAEANGECAAGTAIQYLCALPVGAACNAHNECIGRNCMGGVCTAQCSNAGQCADGGPCSANGVCGMLAGNYCILPEHCKSGVCSGFPRKCQ